MNNQLYGQLVTPVHPIQSSICRGIKRKSSITTINPSSSDHGDTILQHWIWSNLWPMLKPGALQTKQMRWSYAFTITVQGPVTERLQHQCTGEVEHVHYTKYTSTQSGLGSILPAAQLNKFILTSLKLSLDCSKSKEEQVHYTNSGVNKFCPWYTYTRSLYSHYFCWPIFYIPTSHTWSIHRYLSQRQHVPSMYIGWNLFVWLTVWYKITIKTEQTTCCHSQSIVQHSYT